MKHLGLFLLLSFTTISCATLSNSSVDQLPISLSDVELVRIGVDSQSDLEHRFGKAQEQITLSKDLVGLVFLRSDNRGKPFPRASFVLQKESGIVVSALWMPHKTDELNSIETAKSYFKGAQFITTKREWIAHRQDATQITFSDSKMGVSIDTQEDNVTSIGFIAPNQRNPSSGNDFAR